MALQVVRLKRGCFLEDLDVLDTEEIDVDAGVEYLGSIDKVLVVPGMLQALAGPDQYLR